MREMPVAGEGDNQDEESNDQQAGSFRGVDVSR